ncbi:MAG: hypothetical protein ACK5HZ_06015 [Macellibacteroides fermentans]|uniref:hypothetical protein n=1 Tax=Macellibacteroides fermentans TaxID=879969 RepID=UPI003AD64374
METEDRNKVINLKVGGNTKTIANTIEEKKEVVEKLKKKKDDYKELLENIDKIVSLYETEIKEEESKKLFENLDNLSEADRKAMFERLKSQFSES